MEDTQLETVELSVRDLDTLDEYFKNGYNATKAWMATHPECTYVSARALASKWLTKDNIKAEVARRLEEKHMSAEEAFERVSSIGRGDLGMFWKVVDEWMFNPLPSYEILDEKEVIDDTDPEKPVKRISYRVRHVALDMDKVMDPQYSYLIKEFSDDGKKLGIKLYSAYEANRDVLKVHGKLGGGGSNSQRENAGENSKISATPAALLELVGMIEHDKRLAVDQARSIDAGSNDTRSE